MADYRLVKMPNGGFQKVWSREARFWAKVDRLGDNECWPWLAYKSPDGYGFVRDGRRMRPASQVSLEISGSPRPPAPHNQVLHGDDCVTRACVNPAHIRWGSNRENVADRERLGRNKVPHVFGARQGSAKLDDQRALAIRRAPGRQRDIAAQFGISQMTVSLIKQRKTWRHLP